MKKYFLIILAFSALVQFSCSGGNDGIKNSSTASNPAGNGKQPKISFEKTKLALADVHEGEKPVGYFYFTNTGEADLIIVSTRGSCGCTVPEKPEAPIPPGGKGKIKFVFDSAGKVGNNTKDIFIQSNASDEEFKLEFTCNVLPSDGGKADGSTH